MKKKQIVLLTGGSSGIGLAAAVLLMKKGHKVYSASRHGCDYRQDKKSGGEIIGISCDVSDELSVKSAVGVILEKEHRIDTLICNAGNGIAGALEECSDQECRQQFEVNFWGLMNCVRTCIPSMREQGCGKVIAVSSIAGIVPIPYQGLYSASKAAVLMAMQTLAMETKQFGIRCSCVLPGDTRTNFTSSRVYSVQSQSGSSPYKDAMAKALSKMEKDEQNGMSPEFIAKSVVAQVEARKPELIVVPGYSYKAVNVAAKLVPSSLKLLILRKMY